MKQLLLETEALLEKFPGKGGWTYIQIPQTAENGNAFGRMELDVDIDGHEIKNYKLMPMGKGRFFLPVKTEIRKKIGKEAGETVLLKLYAEPQLQISDSDILLCLEDEPTAYQVYMSCEPVQQQEFLSWVYQASNEQDRVERIVEMIRYLSQNRTNVSRW